MLGDLEGADPDLRAGIALMRRLPERLGFALPVWDQMRALLEGRFADAEEHRRPRRVAGRPAAPGLRPRPLGAYLAYLRGDWEAAARLLGRPAEIEPLAMAPYPDRSSSRGGVAGASPPCRSFREDINPLIPDWTRPVQCIFLADTVRLAGDADTARDVYRQFSGLAGWWAVNTFAWCGGPYDPGLGVSRPPPATSTPRSTTSTGRSPWPRRSGARPTR